MVNRKWLKNSVENYIQYIKKLETPTAEQQGLINILTATLNLIDEINAIDLEPDPSSIVNNAQQLYSCWYKAVQGCNPVCFHDCKNCSYFLPYHEVAYFSSSNNEQDDLPF